MAFIAEPTNLKILQTKVGARLWTRNHVTWFRRKIAETNSRDLVVVITHGIDHELSSAALIIALGGMTAGLKVSIFLTSSGVDIVRRGAGDMTHVKPLEPMADMLRDFLARGRMD